MLASKTDPTYPAEAAAKNARGPVVVAVVVDQDGAVMSADDRCGLAVLRPTALNAVKQWQYRPAVYQGKRVEVAGEVVVDVEPPNQPSTSARLRVDSETAQANLLSSNPPVYPGAAAMGRIQGCVIVHCEIGTDGKVQHAVAVSGHPMLLRSAELSAWQNRYQPFTKDGVPVEAETYVIKNFKLQ